MSVNCLHTKKLASAFSSASCWEDPQHISSSTLSTNGPKLQIMAMVLQLPRCSWTSEKHSIVYGTTAALQTRPAWGIPICLKWIQSYLTDRSLFVQIENAISKPFAISSRVPQGSHPGPVLFTVFINDLPDTCRSSTFMPMTLFCIKPSVNATQV